MTSTFADLGVPADLCAALAARGIDTAFPIQEATLPDGLAGRDVSGRAPTGSGKTIAFGLAMIARLERRARPKRPRALVLVPTRELADQVTRELQALGAPRGVTVVAVYGGTGYHIQRKLLRRGTDVLVACPGRLEDLLQQGDLALSDVEIVTVDEADRMADMGFLPAVRRILDQTASERQTLLFSATLDGDVDVLVKRYQKDPVRHEVELAEADTGDIRHVFWAVERDARVAVTADVVTRHQPAIVFTRTRHGADRLVKQLAREGVAAVPIHGNRTQPQRTKALAAFTSGDASVLVATDVAARGIHLDDVACVVHYDPPADEKDYVHRSGRTGRAGADGMVFSLVEDATRNQVRTMMRKLGMEQGIEHPDGRPVADPAPAPRRFDRPSRGGRAGGNADGARAKTADGHAPADPRRDADRSQGRPAAHPGDWHPRPKQGKGRRRTGERPS
jgi:superfamily II DNA/RNA helicase